ncbi:MAG: YciI family protein [Gammaproteobacteria bacterium]
MYYAIISTDVPDSLEKRQSVRTQHLERLRALQHEGRLLLAGPHPNIDSSDAGTTGFSGSLIVAEFPDIDTAQAWADDDPYVQAGVYREVQVKPFKRVFPE